LIQSVVVTGDGSHTVTSDRGIAYHSVRGAITESRHVFIEHGLKFVSSRQNRISILEVGFGTGLNALLTYIFAEHNPNLQISYHGVEKFPLSAEIIDQLNFTQHLGTDVLAPVFKAIHQQSSFERGHFSFRRADVDICDFTGDPGSVDLVYFDAFGPEDQPEMWDIELLSAIRKQMCAMGVLVTYCAQGQFKRNLKSFGFIVEPLPGPPGKREMTRAIKTV
jgi:tRNA U34 5-methylaminomethyl-2-thiouridine-forming methyltransferase MnmC